MNQKCSILDPSLCAQWVTIATSITQAIGLFFPHKKKNIAFPVPQDVSTSLRVFADASLMTSCIYPTRVRTSLNTDVQDKNCTIGAADTATTGTECSYTCSQACSLHHEITDHQSDCLPVVR